MVNKETSANSGTGVNLNTGQETTYMGKQASCKAEFVPPEKTSQSMKPKSM
jgi:hypothetical protein